MKTTIIGAGIGGLTTAIALKQKGFDVEIFEASPVFSEAGAGINLATNAMQVYKRLGLYETILNAGSHNDTMNITDEKLNVLSGINLKHYEEKHKVKSVAIHRTTLHEILLSQLSDVNIHLDKKVKSINRQGKNTEIQFADGTNHLAEVLIGADGINSAIRKSVFDNTSLRIAKQVCWRGIVKMDIDQKYQIELNELWGKGKRFGFVAIGSNEYYWYALANYKNDYQQEYKNVELTELYSDFHPLVAKLIKNTPKESILTNIIADLKPILTWHSGNICLLGDSAHATTPNLGQGACQAIESALVLANCMDKYDSVEKAFEKFQDIRIKKANKIIKTSWNIGFLSQLNNGFLISLRNFVLKITPSKVNMKQTDSLFEIENLY